MLPVQAFPWHAQPCMLHGGVACALHAGRCQHERTKPWLIMPHAAMHSLQMGPVARIIKTKQMCAEDGWMGADACEHAV